MEQIAAYYDGLVDKYGYSPKAVDASSKASLQARHQVLSSVCNMTSKRILEVGCGFGDLGELLVRKYRSQWTRYLGIDISRRMIEEGCKVYPYLCLRWADVMNEERPHDIVLAQGIFYKLGENAEEKTFQLIHKMWDLTKEVLAFTAIYSWEEYQRSKDEYRIDPIQILSFCKIFTPEIILRTDYWPGDCMIAMYKKKEQI